MDNRIRITDLDFSDIKDNLLTYLGSQDVLKDYNYEGSALSTLANILAYNTHYNAIIANMLGNEMFMDSAVSRASIVSRAKEFNYTPKSKTASVAIVNIKVRNVSGNPSSITLPKNTVFGTTINGSSYSFLTNSTYTAQNVSNEYTFSNVKLYEGTLLTSSFVVNTTDNLYTLPNDSIDVSTLRIIVQESSSNLATTSYTRCTDITNITATDPVFFVQGYKDYSYQIYFGDNVLGKQLSNGNIIIAEYIVTNGSLGNNAVTFTRGSSTIAGSSNITITTTQQSTGGTDAETNAQIKFNAPKAYTAQNRMVTPDDYKTLLRQLVNNIKSISVWGGEDNVPPDFGAVYVCIEPTTGSQLTVSEKNNIITTIINSRKMIGIRPVIVDPKYLYLRVESVIYYDSTKTSLTDVDIATNAATAISTYNTNNLEKFDGVFRYSKLGTEIDKSDPSIVSNITNISMHQYLEPIIGTPTSYEINFYNPIYKNEFGTAENSFRSSRGFRILGDTKTYYIEDDGNQYIKLFYLDNANKIYVSHNIGTIDYTHGKIVLNPLNITSIDYVDINDRGLELLAIPESNDIVPIMDMILKIKSSDIKTSAIVDTFTSGYNSAGTNYPFSSSRS